MNKFPTDQEYKALMIQPEPVMEAHWLGGKLYIFTPNHTYIARRIRWYHKVWDFIAWLWK
jgi:hypothetical protein